MRKEIIFYNVIYVIGLYIYPHNPTYIVRIVRSFAQFLEYDQALIFSTPRCTYGSAHLILPIVTGIHSDISYGDRVILNLDFPALEPIVGDCQTSFGKRFGVLFQANHGGWFSRPISSNELLQCYSVHTSRITDHSVLFQMDNAIDTPTVRFLVL